MDVLDRLREMKKRCLQLVREHGEEIAGFAAFKKDLLELNRRHRLAAIRIYEQAIAKIETTTP